MYQPNKQIMSMTIEILAQKLQLLEKQMTMMMADKPTDISDDKPKKKRTSGYIIFSNATRDDVKTQITQGDEKPKNTDVMKELARQWKALSDEERDQWNEKATEIRNAE